MRNRFSFSIIFLSLLLAVAPSSTHANFGEDNAPASNDANYQEGKKAIEAQDWNKAIELLTKAVQAEPNARQPAWKLTDTFSFSGAGSPRAPVTRTRSGACCSRWTASNRATTSGDM